MLDRDRRTYYNDIEKYMQGYAKKRRITIIDFIDAVSEIEEEFYFPNKPRADKDEIKKALDEYAAAQGEPIENIYEIIDEIIEQTLYDALQGIADDD